MNTAPTLPDAVYAVWIGTIVIVVLLVPVAVALLHRTLRAAWSIRRYVAEMEAAGAQIAAHTAAIAALEETRTVTRSLLEGAAGLDEHSGAIARVLAERASSGGRA